MKAFDFNALLLKMLPHLVPVAGEVVDWTAQSLAMNEKPLVKVLGVVVAGIKQPLIDELNKAIANKANPNSAPVVVG